MQVRVVEGNGEFSFVHVESVGDGVRERWTFVAGKGLSMCYYAVSTLGPGGGWGDESQWDGMASQNQPRIRCDRPKSTPREVAIAAYDAVGWPGVSPKVG